MSEKQQHTAAHMRELMEHRYGDGLYHKHNKMHITYRQHCRSHPVVLIIKDDEEKTNLPSTAQSSRKEVNTQERSPASYRPLNQQSAGLNNAPAIHEIEYPSHVETHFNEPDSNNEIENNPPPGGRRRII